MEPIEEEEEQTEPLRAAVDEKVRKYVLERYSAGASGAFLTEQDDGTGAIAVCINSTVTKPSAFWFDHFLYFCLISDLGAAGGNPHGWLFLKGKNALSKLQLMLRFTFTKLVTLPSSATRISKLLSP